MRRRKTRIIVTLGPATAGAGALRALRARGVDFVRTNMSHSSLVDLERAIVAARRAGLPFVIDTEGSQVRSGDLAEQVIRFEENDELRLWSGPEPGHRGGLQLKPPAILAQLEPGDLLHVDFDTLVLRVTDTSTVEQGFVTARTVSGGWAGRNKAVVVDPLSPRPLRLPVLSEKDLESIRIGLREGVEHIAVSFVRSAAAVDEVRAVTQGRMQIISKIECIEALDNLPEIIERSDLLLIDRGDLSKEIAMERIPFVQKLVIHEAAARGKSVYVATNLLETMVEKRNPTRAEVQDVVNTVLDGAAGLTLAAETAIGRFPIECVTMLDRLVEHTEAVMAKAGAPYQAMAGGLAVGLGASGYLAEPDPWPALPPPLGGGLVNRVVPAPPEAVTGAHAVLRLDGAQRAELELIASGAFSPLEGFLGPDDLEAVLAEMTLADGTPWALPVVLEVDPGRAADLPSRGTIALADGEGRAIGCMELERVDVRGPRLMDEALGRSPQAPPGTVLLSGRVGLYAHLRSETRRYQLSPRQTRTLFQARGWRRILGDWWLDADVAQARTQRQALDHASCDGLFVQALIEEDAAVAAGALRACEAAVEAAHRRDTVLVAALAGCPRPRGVRGLLLGALVRLNFGCTHVRLDAGVTAAEREALGRLEALGIELIEEPETASPIVETESPQGDPVRSG